MSEQQFCEQKSSLCIFLHEPKLSRTAHLADSNSMEHNPHLPGVPVSLLPLSLVNCSAIFYVEHSSSL